MREHRAFSTFMDRLVNTCGEKIRDTLPMKKGKFRKDRLQEASKARGILKNADLARFLKMNYQTTHKWWSGATGNISATDLFYVADKLNVNERWLMGLSDTMARGITLTAAQQACLELFDELPEGWREDWMGHGNRILNRLEIRTPPVRKTPTITQ